MKLIFTADVHLDGMRGADTFKYFGEVIEYAHKIGAAAVLIGGDLFDCPYPSKESCAAVRALIGSHKNIQFLAVCGNHDPLYTTAFYSDVPDNMYVFPGEITKYPLGDIDIYGVSLKKQVDTIDPWNGFHADGRFITLSHGMLDGDESYSLRSRTLADTGAVLSLMGHIHQSEEHILSNGARALYSGCLVGRGFDECGDKGFYEIDTDSLNYTFIKSGAPIHKEYEADISNAACIQDVLSILQDITVGSNEIARAVLVGNVKKAFNIDTDAILQYLPQFAGIKDKSGLDIDVFRNKDENTLEGEFIRILEKSLENADESERTKILDAMKEGILALR